MPLLNANEKPLGVIIMLHTQLIERAGYVEAFSSPRIEAELKIVVESKFN